MSERRTVSGVIRPWLPIWGAIWVLALAACASDPAPVYDRSSNPYRKAAPSETRISRPSAYVVRKGDTLYSIAWRYGLDHRTLARWNGIRAPFTIYPEQRLRLKPPRNDPANTPSAPAVATAPQSKPPQSRQPASKPATQPTTRPTSRPPASSPASSPAPRNSGTTRPPSASNTKGWQWPTEGPVISSFSDSDPARKGLDIAGQEGQDVKAISSGEVVYSGVGLIGYGELIIIKHDQRYLSAYGHNRKRLVSEGDQVTRGQKIAEMGSTGADRTKLHFEIRQDGEPVDPQRFLPPR